MNGETSPAQEQLFSLCAPHPEWIQKGQHRPTVELGHKFLIATEQPQLLQDDTALLPAAEGDQSLPGSDRLLGRYGAGRVASARFDQGFTRTADRELLGLAVPLVVRPKRGKKNAAETERESGPQFVALRKQPRAGEREITSLAQHGLHRGLDVGGARLLALRGTGGAELQPACHRPGLARAATSPRRHARAGGLPPPPLQPPAQSDRSRVLVAGDL